MGKVIDTSALVSRSITLVTAYFILGIAVTFYSLYLNYKQSKVRDLMKELIKEVKEIKEIVGRNKKE